MGPLRAAAEAWKGGLQGRTSPHPLSRSVPPGFPPPPPFRRIKNFKALSLFASGSANKLTFYVGVARTVRGPWSTDSPGPPGRRGPHIHTYSDLADVYLYHMILNTALFNQYISHGVFWKFGNDAMGALYRAPWWRNDKWDPVPLVTWCNDELGPIDNMMGTYSARAPSFLIMSWKWWPLIRGHHFDDMIPVLMTQWGNWKPLTLKWIRGGGGVRDPRFVFRAFCFRFFFTVIFSNCPTIG